MAKQFNIGCGLINKRQNCFMNAVLQAYFRIPKIANHLQIELNTANKCNIRNCISCMVVNLYGNIYSSKVACSPYQLYGALKQTNSRFAQLLNGEHQDSHEFLMLFNQELEKKPHSVRWFADNFTANLTTHVVCGSCGKVHKSYSVVTDISLHVVKNGTVQTAMDSYFDHDDIEYLCETCRTYDFVKKKHFLVAAPAYLCLHLRRFSDGGSKITDKIEISLELSLAKHFLQTQDSEWKYKLVAVVNHFGESRSIGHYNTIVLAANGEHYELDDRNVRKVSSNQVSGKDAYILFYELIKEPPHSDSVIGKTSQINNDFEDQANTNEDRRASNEIDDFDETVPNSIPDQAEKEKEQLAETKTQSQIYQQKIPGRRIVDMDYVFNQMRQITRFECTNCENGTFTYSKEIRRGLQSSFIFVCGDCGKILRVNSCPTYDETENINISAILGITAIGLGHYHLQEFLAHLNVPSMSYATYHKYEEDKIQQEYFKLSKQLEAEALDEEIRLARKQNDVDSAGNALIPVEFDGSWEKRAYTGNFSSLAGCAAIIGLRTKKILYSGVKKKYCHICKIAKSRNVTPRNHKCRKNYDGPSGGMETEIIIDGFKYCAEKGARFNRFVGDGDCSTYKALRDLQLYKDPPVSIEKFECVNHLFRNFFKQWKALLRSTKLKRKGRKLLNLEIGRNICKGIRLAAKHWRLSNIGLEEKYSNLERDVMNAFLHYVGVHNDCAEYFCTHTTDADALNVVTELKETGVYYEVLDLIQKYFGNNVKSLVAGLCTNKTEGFNSLIAKYLAGKRVCNCLAGSYDMRTNIADVQYNTDGHSGSTVQQFIFGESIPMSKALENKRKRKCLDNTIAKQNRPKTYTNDESSSKKKAKVSYGDGREEVDFTEAQLDVAKNRLFERLRENQVDRNRIQVETVSKQNSFEWGEIRKIMLTSSYFGRILNVRSRNSYTKIVEEIVYNNYQHGNTAEMRHQRIYEKHALLIFSRLYQFEEITNCGIFIDEEIAFLGASPFRLYGDNGIVAIKCPKKEFGKNLRDAMKTISFWTGTAADRRVNVKSHWYREIQGQLHITKRQMAYLMIYLGDEQYEIVEIEKNDEFWKQEMEEELVYFYNEALIKELVNPRHERGMDLRKYNPKKQIFE